MDHQWDDHCGKGGRDGECPGTLGRRRALVRLEGLAEPIADSDAATKAYADSMTVGGRGYLSATPSANFQMWPTGDMVFDTNVVSSGISIDTGTGIVTLVLGKTYLLTATIFVYGASSSGNSGFTWVDTANAALPNFGQVKVWTPNGGNSTNTTAVSSGFFTPTSSPFVKVRITSQSSGGTQSARALGTSIVITEV